MSEWDASLVELDRELGGSGTPAGSGPKKRRRVGSLTPTASKHTAQEQSEASAPGDATGITESLPSPGNGASPAAALSTTLASVPAVTASSPISELDRLRAENESLKRALDVRASTEPAAVAAAAANSCTMPRVRPDCKDFRPREFHKMSVRFSEALQFSSRRQLEAWVLQAAVLRDSKNAEDSDDDTFAAKNNRSFFGTCAFLAPAVDYFQTFCIDTLGLPRLPAPLYQPLDYELFDVPGYEGPLNVVPLPCNSKSAQERAAIINKKMGACFNCGSNEHGVRDCPHPRDESCIRLNSWLYREFAQGRNKTDGTAPGSSAPTAVAAIASGWEAGTPRRIETSNTGISDSRSRSNAATLGKPSAAEGEILLDESEGETEREYTEHGTEKRAADSSSRMDGHDKTGLPPSDFQVIDALDEQETAASVAVSCDSVATTSLMANTTPQLRAESKGPIRELPPFPLRPAAPASPADAAMPRTPPSRTTRAVLQTPSAILRESRTASSLGSSTPGSSTSSTPYAPPPGHRFAATPHTTQRDDGIHRIAHPHSATWRHPPPASTPSTSHFSHAPVRQPAQTTGPSDFPAAPHYQPPAVYALPTRPQYGSPNEQHPSFPPPPPASAPPPPPQQQQPWAPPQHWAQQEYGGQQGGWSTQLGYQQPPPPPPPPQQPPQQPPQSLQNPYYSASVFPPYLGQTPSQQPAEWQPLPAQSSTYASHWTSPVQPPTYPAPQWSQQPYPQYPYPG